MFDLSIKIFKPLLWFVTKLTRNNVATTSRQTIDFQQLNALQFHIALHNAYRSFSRHHQQWIQRGFNLEFLREEFFSSRTRNSISDLPTGMELAMRWDRRFGILAIGADRVRLSAELVSIANGFVETFKKELHKLSR